VTNQTKPDEALGNLSLSTSRARFKLGRVVCKRRTQLGLRQSDLAERAGLPKSLVADVEGGGRDATLHTVARICGGLHLRLSELSTAIENDSGETNVSFGQPELNTTQESPGLSAPRICGRPEFPLCQLGKVIRKRRFHLGLSLGTIEERGGLPRSYLQHIEAGRLNLRFGKLARLSAALGLRLSELCTAIEKYSSETKEEGGKAEANKTDEGLFLSLSRMYGNLEHLLHQLGKVVCMRRADLGFRPGRSIIGPRSMSWTPKGWCDTGMCEDRRSQTPWTPSCAKAGNTMAELTKPTPAAPGKGAITLLFHVGRPRRALPGQHGLGCKTMTKHSATRHPNQAELIASWCGRVPRSSRSQKVSQRTRLPRADMPCWHREFHWNLSASQSAARAG
jgi:transcriptional regulator with XRE-family HTH domain